MISRHLVRVGEEHFSTVHDEGAAQAQHTLRDLPKLHAFWNGAKGRNIRQVVPPLLCANVRRPKSFRGLLLGLLVLSIVEGSEPRGLVRSETVVVHESRVPRNGGVQVQELVQLFSVANRHEHQAAAFQF
eukprot:CAMPEP_0171807100 /NCGR_PEP_ID=MMETSP0991-20121206/75655_1 /TAXON_ID=483369 /ORGANISM="non described non described, Strain CCMP2098" /LENGTH=129 /DNA_ID=CAMNT_0012419899 /DNA_START=184 /DNA_END=573 /DNA_ORIENTATION=+